MKALDIDEVYILHSAQLYCMNVRLLRALYGAENEFIKVRIILYRRSLPSRI